MSLISASSSTADSEVEVPSSENQELPNAVSLSPGGDQNIVSRAFHTTRIAASRISSFHVHFTLVFPDFSSDIVRCVMSF